MVKQNNYSATVRKIIDGIDRNNLNMEAINRTASLLLSVNNYMYDFQNRSKYNMFMSNIVMQLVAAELAAKILCIPVYPIADVSKIASEEAAKNINFKK